MQRASVCFLLFRVPPNGDLRREGRDKERCCPSESRHTSKTYIDQNPTNTDNFFVKSKFRELSLSRPGVRTEDDQGRPSHMPRSAFYEKVIPGMLFLLGLVTVGLILFALGVLLGVISF